MKTWKGLSRAGCWLAAALAVIPARGQVQVPDVNQSLIDTDPDLMECRKLEEASSLSRRDYADYVRCVLEQHHSMFTALYTEHLSRAPEERGDVEVRLTIRQGGSVKTVSVSAPGMEDKEFLDALKSRVRLIKFRGDSHREQEVSYTFPFSRVTGS